MSGRPYDEQPELHEKAPHRAALLNQPGNLKQAIREATADPKKIIFGIAQGIPSVFFTKLIASTRPDWVWIDFEHGMFNRLEVNDAVQAASHHSEGKTMAIVRCAKEDVTTRTTALDAGASGIIIPHCESAQEVKDFLREVYFPPLGVRSFSPWTFAQGVSDASLYPNDGFNMQTSNNHIAVIAQIESVKGLENIDEIAALEGVDALMFGPGDYSADAGLGVQMGTNMGPELMQAVQKFAEAGKRAGKPLFGNTPSIEAIPMLMELGYRLIGVAFDVWDISHLFHGNLVKGRQVVKEVLEAKEAAGSA